MPYRTTQVPSPRCLICNGPTLHTCRNCHGPHCSAHLQEGACSGCGGQLWSIERRVVQGIGGIFGVAAIPLVLVAVMLTFSGASAWLGFTILFVLPMGYFSIPRLTRPIVRRALARKTLSPTSRRLLPAAPEPAQATPQSAQVRANQIQSRHRRMAAQRPKKRLSVLGRGFYLR